MLVLKFCIPDTERGFFYSGPAAWNTLQSDLHDITEYDYIQKTTLEFTF